jgi:hypothetical protein
MSISACGGSEVSVCGVAWACMAWSAACKPRQWELSDGAFGSCWSLVGALLALGECRARTRETREIGSLATRTGTVGGHTIPPSIPPRIRRSSGPILLHALGRVSCY